MCEATTSFTKVQQQIEVKDIPNIREQCMEHHFSTESGDSDTQGKGRDTEEEDEIHDISMERNLDDGNLRQMVMEVIFGRQLSVKTEFKKCCSSKVQK